MAYREPLLSHKALRCHESQEWNPLSTGAVYLILPDAGDSHSFTAIAQEVLAGYCVVQDADLTRWLLLGRLPRCSVYVFV